MTVKETTADILVNEDADLAESPIWDHRDGKLIWSDISKNIIWRTDISNCSSQQQILNQPIGCVAPYKENGYVFAGGNGFFEIETFGQNPTLINTAFENKDCKINDGKIDRHGRFWAGSACIGTDKELGFLYCLDNDRTSHGVFGGITASNGFDWSPDGRFFYYVDTAAGGIDIFDVTRESGEFQKRRRFVDIPFSLGLADGLTVDNDGCVWLAIWYAGAVYRFAPTGELMEKISVPVCRTSSCVFGGADMRTLFITTAKGGNNKNYPTEEMAGSVFAIKTNTSGQIRPGYLG